MGSRTRGQRDVTVAEAVDAKPEPARGKRATMAFVGGSATSADQRRQWTVDVIVLLLVGLG